MMTRREMTELLAAGVCPACGEEGGCCDDCPTPEEVAEASERLTEERMSMLDVTNPDAEMVWDEPLPVTEGADLPAELDFDELAEL